MYLSSLQTHTCIIQDAFTLLHRPKLQEQAAHRSCSCTARGGGEQLVLVSCTGANGHQLCSINYIYDMAVLVPLPSPSVCQRTSHL